MSDKGSRESAKPDGDAMSGDLFTLRMIVVSDQAQDRDLWRDAARLASVPIDITATEVGETCPIDGKGHLDVVVVDAEVKNWDLVIKAARALTPRPIVSVASPSSAKFEGADAVVRRPKSTEEARKFIEQYVRMRTPKRVLIVDDSTTMRSIVRKILSASRYALEVSEADEGIAALKNIDRGVDLVLLDYNMPGFNGIETLTEIKRVAPQVNVVIMTSTEGNKLADQAEASGAAAFLRKPFYPTDIDGILDRIYT
jgi:CheY-like chemotaxis protein